MINDNERDISQILNDIIRVLAFFDLFDYPLTTLEIYNYLDKKFSLEEIYYNLDNNRGFINQKNGFYFLSGRSQTVDLRQERYNYALRKLKIARRFACLFSFLPFVRVVALSNSIGAHNLRDASDIDFFIITASRRIWLTRLYCTGLAKILNRRPTSVNKRDKICLSFYISNDSLNLDSLQLNDSDPYFFYWLRSLVLLYNKNETYEEFLRANNLITLKFVEQEKKINKNSIKGVVDYLELIAKKIQLIIMNPALKKAMNNSEGVFINDQILKLYLRDKRREYKEKYGHQLRKIFAKSN